MRNESIYNSLFLLSLLHPTNRVDVAVQSQTWPSTWIRIDCDKNEMWRSGG